MTDTAATAVDVAANLAAVKARIAAAAKEAGRDPAGVRLVAVAKTHGHARIRPAILAGQRRYGENRVQEAAAKWPALRAEFSDLRLHLIGGLQTNKAREAVALFDAIETVDRPKLAEGLAHEIERQGRRPDLFVQVNTGAEPQKGGVLPLAADALIAHVRGLGLVVAGLMCIPPADEEPGLHFALLADIAARNSVAGLSMGMSHDYEIAVRFGATHVRVGTAIFGAKE
ncbi:MAG: YggS family pyridoxal phosphate-dependent enzyme [Alphaproteobacteria bacterium]|nr:YggS family pyridoxal phosphate-dependent enzyme [Alphaproteobacteria bacterium]